MNSGICKVMKFDGTNWLFVGSPSGISDDTHGITLAINSSGIPYLAYINSNELWYHGTPYVWMFNGYGWLPVGGIPSYGKAEWLSLAIGPGDVPYLAFEDDYHGSKVSVMKYNGTGWDYVGLAGFSTEIANYISLVVTNSGVPIVAFSDSSNDVYLHVMKYEGGTWQNVGSPIISTSSLSSVDLKMCSDGNPIVAYGPDATVKKYNGSQWNTVGNPGFTGGEAEYMSLALNQNDIPFVAFSDWPNYACASVMYYGYPLGMDEKSNAQIPIYPNPSSSNIVLDLSNIPGNNKQMEIFDVRGDLLYSANTSENRVILNICDYPADLYFFTVTANNTVYRGKFCKI